MSNASEEIMLATHDALAEVGYADLSISTIADHFDGSQSLIYYHYEDKEELLVAFLEHLISGLEEELEEIDALDPSERIEAVIDLLLPVPPQEEPFRFHHALIEIRVQTPYHDPYRERFERLDERLSTLFEDAILEAREAKTFSDVDPQRAADRLLTDIYGLHYRNVPMENIERIRDSREWIAEQIQKWEETP